MGLLSKWCLIDSRKESLSLPKFLKGKTASERLRDLPCFARMVLLSLEMKKFLIQQVMSSSILISQWGHFEESKVKRFSLLNSHTLWGFLYSELPVSCFLPLEIAFLGDLPHRILSPQYLSFYRLPSAQSSLHIVIWTRSEPGISWGKLFSTYAKVSAKIKVLAWFYLEGRETSELKEPWVEKGWRVLLFRPKTMRIAKLYLVLTAIYPIGFLSV